MGAYENFIGKLDAFLCRYYTNRAWKGFFTLLASGLLVFLVFCTLEYLMFLSVGLRKLLFWLFVTLFSVGSGYWVLYPLGQSRGWFKRMSHKEAARYLALCYPELDDRLYNVLDLRKQLDENPSLYTLFEAAIEQISKNFVSYRFEKVVRFNSNVRYIVAFLAVFILFSAVFINYPGVIGSSKRIVNYNQVFERVFPFKITVENHGMRALYEEDFVLRIGVEGEVLPEEIFVESDGLSTACKKESANLFSFTFKKVRQPITFHIVSGKYRSQAYKLEVDYKPLISGMKVTLHYPLYMGRKPETLTNSLNLTVPAGTRIDWELKVEHAEELLFGFVLRDAEKDNSLEKRSFEKAKAEIPVFSFSRSLFNSCAYFIFPKSSVDVKTDTSVFFVEILPDIYPQIEVLQTLDSNRIYRRYFRGMISDDYGFHSLVFKIDCSNGKTGDSWTFLDTLDIEPGKSSQEFSYYFDIDAFNIQAGDELTYGFEVRDNDVFYPFKASYSSTFSYRRLSQEELREEMGRNSASVDSKFSLTLQSIKNFDRELQELVQDLLSKKQLSWQEQKQVELLLEEQQQLRQTYKELSEEIKEKQRLQDELGEMDEELKEKQQQLQELMNKLFDDSTMKKLQELQELMRMNAPREKLTDVLENIKQQKDLLSQDIERNLNLYKQLEFENKLHQAVSDAQKLAGKSKDITAGMKDLTNDSVSALQKELEKDRKRLQDDLNKLEALNDNLEKSTSFSAPDSLLEKARKSIENTQSHLQNQQEKQARQSQEKTDEALQELADNLSGQMQDIEEENQAEDADFIRLLLKSTVRVSLHQEELMEELGKTKLNDPRYAEQISKQAALNTEIRFVADSLNAIAKRQPQVALSTHQEVRNILLYSRETLDLLLAMNNIYYQYYNTTNSRALARQQYTMTSLNNLALLLSESLDRMQQQLNMKGSSGSSKKKQRGQPQMSCPKPGEKNSSMPMPSIQQMQQGKKSLQQMQQDLNRQLDELKKMLQQMQGKGKPQSSQPSNEVKSGESGNSQGGQVSDEKISESFARAAAQQEMIRRMLQDKMQKDKMNNPGNVGMYNQILGDMERTERDLVNRVLNDQVLSRQKNIESRLLEAENAELKREKDDRRESKEGSVFDPFQGDSIENDKSRRIQGSELLRFSYPEMRPYYKKKVQDFLFETDKN